MYSVEFTKAASKTLGTVPGDLRQLVLRKIEAVAGDPHGAHNNVTRMVGRSEFRLRVHDWRAIYRVQDDRVVLLVIKIGTRGQVYL